MDVERLLAQEGAKRVDVIVTSYGTLASEFAKWKKNKDKPNYEGGSIYDRAFSSTLRITLRPRSKRVRRRSRRSKWTVGLSTGQTG